MANGNDAVSRRFGILKQQAEQQERRRTQEEQEGLRRRFASLGQLGSGAAIKTEQKAQQAASRRLGDIQSKLDIAESQERQRLQEIKEGREFQRGEREAGQMFAAEQAGLGRGFQAEQAKLGRQFARGERLGGQEFAGQQATTQRRFAAEQAGLGREFQRGEREAGQTFAGQQAALQRRFLTGEREAGQTFAGQQADIQRAFARGEREAGQTFAGEQARLGREFQRGERIGSQEFASQEARFQREEAARQFDIGRLDKVNMFREQMDFQQANSLWQEQLARAEYDLNTQISFANLDNAQRALEQGDRGIFESMFPGLGGGDFAGARDVFPTTVGFGGPGLTSGFSFI